MARLMFDSDQPAVLFTPQCDGALLATYADLATPELVAQGGDRLVWIDRGNGDPMNLATVADIEPALLTVEQGAAKVKQWIAERRPFPTAYHDRAQWAAVNDALAGEAYAHWLATLDGTLVPNGLYMAAVQFADAAKLGFHADCSIVWADNWHPAKAGPNPAQLAALDKLAATGVQLAGQLYTEVKAL